MKIGIIGNGNVATRIATLLRTDTHEVVVGVRRPQGGQASFSEAATHGDVVILTVPYLAANAVLTAVRNILTGKIVIDVTNPLNEDWSPLSLGADSSGGEEIQRLVPEARVVKAFNTIFADAMMRRTSDAKGTQTAAFLCGDDAEARQVVAALARDAGFAPVDAGPLKCARYLEAMAHLNIQLAVAMGGGTRAVFGYHTPQDFAEAV